ncbi:MAG: pantetheine-phosphate adenylyltransferase [Peptococcaceae bacterium]|jgi:pantetheine-phosphate adenylyltransferase|nr:pantetheine-phosphate adenylyltransferase [Peptococcaceae bacterium]
MRIAVYPGSFDPVTNGHIHIAKRAGRLFDQVIIGLANQNYKSALFSLQERLSLLEDAIRPLPNCRVTLFDGLTVDFARQNGAVAIIRGLRAVSDYEYEMQVAAINKHLADDMETIFLMAHSKYSFLSSTMIKQISSSGGQVTGLVTPAVESALKEKWAEGGPERGDSF